MSRKPNIGEESGPGAQGCRHAPTAQGREPRRARRGDPQPTRNGRWSTGPGDASAPAAERPAGADRESIIRALAARQHGVVTRDQLLGAGLPPHVVEYRVKKRRFDRLYRGVYRVGPAAAAHESEMAAVLACGESAVLSHRSAASVWRLLSRPVGFVPVDVSVERRFRAPGSDLRVHRVASLPPDETTVRNGIPITTPERTIIDLGGCARAREVEQALAQAERSGLTTRAQVRVLLARYLRRPGTRALRALVDTGATPAFVRSEAETRFRSLIRKARLDAPAINVSIHGHEVDFLWPAARLVVEIDGFAFHSDAYAFERDRQRDAELTAAGLRVMRVTWRQLCREPEAVLVRLVRLLLAGDARAARAARDG